MQSCYAGAASSLVIYAADYVSPHDSGFVSGNNAYGDMEKAQHYSNASGITLTGVAVLLNMKASSHTAGTGAKINLYAFSSNQPGSLLASTPVRPQDSLSSVGYTIFNFASPVTVSTDFLVSVVLPKHAGDTLAVYGTKINCNSGSSLSWERVADSTFGTLHTDWNLSSGNDIDLAIFPLVRNLTSGIPESFASNPGLVYDAAEQMFFDRTEAHCLLEIFDVSGRRLSAVILEPGKSISLSAVPAGYYSICMTTENSRWYKKIIKK
ncbi:MAG TPA: T9SS type A sorting domain-containing protein [Bacteroidia bacterium]|nr:T9SS type A sorting domain-containing protein [Bacteroidia bacterium]